VSSRDRRVAKSTLIKVLSGYHTPKSGGGIRIQREDVPVKSSVTLLTAGCRFGQQDLV
jgi:ABC-type sugar transport system ATPase subunit